MIKQNIFVPEDIAELAKDNNFDNPCLAHFSNDDGTNITPAPLYQQMITWFKEKHNITISIKPLEINEFLLYEGYIKNNLDIIVLEKTDKSHILVLEFLFKEAFKII